MRGNKKLGTKTAHKISQLEKKVEKEGKKSYGSVRFYRLKAE